ncbi:hypothetical protein EC957_006235 [Mortierella hygrophila]|uniref:Ribosome biogenesis protein SLX9 n=1 Tax=Mortierella hygrophila TaxID=979708 RepID=A0A9P6EYC1_9FUNG|nr:hypothetical protein EC957_006235 [Mortierella hygrophila]
MPKVKASKSRVHHKAVGGKAAYVHPVIEAPTQTPSAESMQSMKEQFGLEFEDDRVDKKDKRKLRHDKWMSKLEATYNPQKKKKKAGQNQSLSLDFGAFHDVLSTIDPAKATQVSPAAVIKGSKSKAAGGNQAAAPAVAAPVLDHQQFTIHSESSKPLQSKKAKKKAAMQEILRFQNVMAHPSFKSNPLLTIQQHVKNTMEMAPPEPNTTISTGPESMED